MPKQMFDGLGNVYVMYDTSEVAAFKKEIEQLKTRIAELEVLIEKLKEKRVKKDALHNK